jgi:hypothetical protein
VFIMLVHFCFGLFTSEGNINCERTEAPSGGVRPLIESRHHPDVRKDKKLCDETYKTVKFLCFG